MTCEALTWIERDEDVDETDFGIFVGADDDSGLDAGLKTGPMFGCVKFLNPERSYKMLTTFYNSERVAQRLSKLSDKELSECARLLCNAYCDMELVRATDIKLKIAQRMYDELHTLLCTE